MTESQLSPTAADLLRDFEPWPVMLTLHPAVLAKLDRLVFSARMGGVPAVRKEIFGVLVLYRASASGKTLGQLVRSRLPEYRPPTRRPSEAVDVPVMLEVPPPVSLRLDGLVSRARAAGVTAYRKDIVSSLVLAERPNKKRLADDCERYRRATARAAALPRQPVAEVLDQAPPSPGPRAR